MRKEAIMEEAQNYLCIEYKNPETNQYGKCYISFDWDGKLNYDQLHFYTLEEIDLFFKMHSKEEIINQVREDNIFYYLQDADESEYINLSIRYHQNGKERMIESLSKDCLDFDFETFLQTNLNDVSRKIIYNNLGGYLNNPKVSQEMKEWIKSIRVEESEELITALSNLPYIEQRKIHQIAFDVLTQHTERNEQETIENGFTRKKIQDKVA